MCSQRGNSICTWPFQGAAVWLDGWLCYHLLQPLLYVRNQGGLGSQSNIEYWKGYRSAADYKLFLTAMVINIQVPHSRDKDCNKNRWGQGVNFILWQWSGRKQLNRKVWITHSFVTEQPVNNLVNWLQGHEWGPHWHKSVLRVHLPVLCFGSHFTIIIAFSCTFSPLSYFYMAFKNEIAFWNTGSFIFSLERRLSKRAKQKCCKVVARIS